jgi:hypothetical protein
MSLNMTKSRDYVNVGRGASPSTPNAAPVGVGVGSDARHRVQILCNGASFRHPRLIRCVPIPIRRACLSWIRPVTLVVACVAGASTAQAQSPVPSRAAAGAQHSLVLDAAGQVWAFGGKSNGELGDNSTAVRRVPQLVPGLTNIIAVAAGTSHSLALPSSGTVYAFGDNLYGQIGDGTTTDRRTTLSRNPTSAGVALSRMASNRAPSPAAPVSLSAVYLTGKPTEGGAVVVMANSCRILR